jgi:hypothetical protein
MNGLFKYFPTDEDKLERFTNGQVYLTPPKYFNDPWDFRPRSEPWTKESAIRADPSLALEPENKLLDFLRHMNTPSSLEAEAAAQQEGLSELVGVVSLTEDPMNRLLWANYGGSHEGFVAEFRCTEFRHANEEAEAFSTCLTPFGGGAARKVKYRQQPKDMKRDGSEEYDVFWTKHKLWTYEQEWRVVESLKKADRHPTRKGYTLLWFKPDDLLRVILGLRARPRVRFQLRQMLNHEEFEHVHKEEVCIEPNSRELKLRPLSW